MKKTLDLIISIVSYLVGLLLLAAIFVIALQVIWRYVFVNPLSWTEQTCRYMFVYIVTLAIPVAYYKGTMLTFDLILKSLNHTLFTIVQALINVLSLVFFFYYGYQAVSLIIQGGWRVTQGVPVKMGVLYAVQPVSVVLCIIILIYQTMELFKPVSEKSGEVKEV